MLQIFFRIDSQKKPGRLLNSNHEQVYLFYFAGSLEKTTKYNLGGNRSRIDMIHSVWCDTRNKFVQNIVTKNRLKNKLPCQRLLDKQGSEISNYKFIICSFINSNKFKDKIYLVKPMILKKASKILKYLDVKGRICVLL